ncbi:MAG: mono/diheme cytochrome c family protein [Chlamydiales bacterium]|jgi:mono/diheme cytochrome c family protein
MIQNTARIALLLGLVSAGCSSGKKNVPAEQQSGAELYSSYCAQCHGKTGTGGFMNLGPSYKGIAKFWDAERLIEYIDDPQAFAANVDRLGERSMTAIADSVKPEARKRLVEHALSLMD